MPASGMKSSKRSSSGVLRAQATSNNGSSTASAKDWSAAQSSLQSLPAASCSSGAPDLSDRITCEGTDNWLGSC
eukprot:scaffold562393_cov28-Prasinocladus_malaysianus.AAC.1